MRILTLAALLLMPALARAEATCALDETIDSCYTRLMLVGHPSAAQVVTEEKVAEVAKSQPGADSSGGQVQSTLTDLIPLLNALGLVNFDDTNDGTLSLDLNFLLPVQEADKNAQLTGLINLKPEPYQPLIDAFPEAVRSTREDELSKKIEDTGDSKLEFTWSLVNERFGRDFRRQQKTLDAMLSPLIAESRAVNDPQNQPRTAYLQMLDGLNKSGLIDKFPDPDDPGSAKFSELPADARGPLMAAVATAATSAGQYQKAVSEYLHQRLVATGASRLAKLVLQQPQLLFSASKEFRDELVGPEAWSVKVTYEQSFASLGHFLRTTQSCKLDALKVAKSTTDVSVSGCYDALGKYLEEHASDLQNEDRFAFSAEYRKISSASYAFPADGVALDVPSHDRLVVSAGYGRVLPRSTTKDRIDFKLDYDSAIDDTASAQSRFVASLTYTRRIMDMDIPFGIVYANKSEFLEGVDKTVSLHVGVKFSPK